MSIVFYENIILHNGIFYINKEQIKEVSIHNRINISFIPSDIELLQNLDLVNIEVYNKIIILIDGFHDNIGHLLWDFMYPSYYGLLYYKEDDWNIDFQ